MKIFCVDTGPVIIALYCKGNDIHYVFMFSFLYISLANINIIVGWNIHVHVQCRDEKENVYFFCDFKYLSEPQNIPANAMYWTYEGKIVKTSFYQ